MVLIEASYITYILSEMQHCHFQVHNATEIDKFVVFVKVSHLLVLKVKVFLRVKGKF